MNTADPLARHWNIPNHLKNSDFCGAHIRKLNNGSSGSYPFSTLTFEILKKSGLFSPYI
jgi:hypothetical protein